MIPIGPIVNLAYNGYMAARSGSKAKRSMADFEKRDAAIPLDDPEQRSILNRLGNQERYYRAGTDTNTAYANRLAMNAGAQAQTNLVRAGGPGIIQNLLSSQAVTGRQLGANAAQAAGMANQMLGMQGDLVNLMAQRRYDRQRYRRDLSLMQGTQYQQDANNHTQAGITSATQLADKLLDPNPGASY